MIGYLEIGFMMLHLHFLKTRRLNMRKNILVKLLGLFSLVIIIGYQASVISFSHIHIINGTIISHMHGFAPGEKQSHGHSDSELAKIEVLFRFVVTTLSEVMTLTVLMVLIRELISRTDICRGYDYVFTLNLRGPPALFR